MVTENAAEVNAALNKEKLMFVNKDLFRNPMIKPLPQVENKPGLKLENDDQQEENPAAPHALVQVNPLSSSKSLRAKERCIQEERDEEEEVIFSLFDVKGNSKFKRQTESGGKDK